MSKNKPPGESSFEGDLLVILIAVLLVVVIAWAVFGAAFSSAMSQVREVLITPMAWLFEGAAGVHQLLVQNAGRPLDFAQTNAMLSKSGYYVRWLFIPLFLLLAVLVYVRSPRSRFAKRHTMQSLAKQEVTLWPELSPVVNIMDDLVQKDVTKGPWAVPMTEWEFSLKHKIATRESGLDRTKARQVFIKQLGPRWSGHRNLPKPLRALYATLLCKACGDSETALRYIHQMAIQAGGPNGARGVTDEFADAIIEKYRDHDVTKQIHLRHAYVYTVFATLLQVARTDVLPSASFRWMKTIDRRLWFTLSNTGRQAFFVEAAGVMAHWLYEKTLGEAVYAPMVNEAVINLERELAKFSEDNSYEQIYF